MKTIKKNTIAQGFHCLFLLLASLLSIPSIAANMTEQESPGISFAKVWRLSGEVTAGSPGSPPRRLREGGAVYVGERIKTSARGEAVFKTADAGLIAVRPDSEFVAERFAAEGKSTDHQILRLIVGSLRVITGWIGKVNKDEHRIHTPSATIGIRGTDHEPYVLPAELASRNYPQGTYDKVNRGATSLEAAGSNLDIESGRVGFVREVNRPALKTRGLMTLMLPVLLDTIPEFYVPGTFEKELDDYSKNSEKENSTRLATPDLAQAQPAATKPTGQNALNAAVDTQKSAQLSGCVPQEIGEHWLRHFDQAISQREVKTIISLFSSDLSAKANIRTQEGMTSYDFTRDELVKSTLSAISNLKNHQQRRVFIEASLADGEEKASCRKIFVKSLSIEQGLMNDKPYRIEALEEFLLEWRAGEWLAVKAQTTQR